MKIGHYEIIHSIGKGGMGEVYLAFDPETKRNVAIKHIRPDLKTKAAFRRRFLREALLTAKLTHPGIITIYTICQNEDDLYYTMPFVDGKTLKQLLQEKNSLSITSFLPIFKSICQTVAYAHSKGIIHRDLKPENILVGHFGEVILLDWGLAESLSEPHEKDEEGHEIETHPELTHPGKIVGTLAYMAPERAFGERATFQTDLYSLGVILYQMLTLHLPFERNSLKEFRKGIDKEELSDPEERAPYRDVAPTLSRLVKKALCRKKEERYPSVEALLSDLLNHMEGRFSWLEERTLQVNRKKDWEFQENVLISKHLAVTRLAEAATWLFIMVSKASFSETIRLHTRLRIGKGGAGIGFLLNVPEAPERETPLSGYCLWLGTEEEPYTQIFRNTVEAMRLDDLSLKKETWHELVLEKSGNHITLILDGVQRLKYVSYLPLAGTHVGLVSRDGDFEIEEIKVDVGGQNLTVSCLAIPDSFLAAKDYKRALAEYRRIGYSFPGHAEGREALFRAGITLLEQAKATKNDKRTEVLTSLALDEFARLHHTPGAPLEYLGKALVYQTLLDHNEEIKCLELGLRRYCEHPLISTVKEQILYRMHESSQNDRRSAYRLMLISLRQLPEVMESPDSLRLFKGVLKHSEPLLFFENPLDPSTLGKESNLREKKLSTLCFSTLLAFWLSNAHSLLEILHDLLQLEPLDAPAIGNVLFALFECGAIPLALEQLEALKKREHTELQEILSLLEPLAICYKESLQAALAHFLSLKRIDVGVKEFRTLTHLIRYGLSQNQESLIPPFVEQLLQLPVSREDRVELDAYRIWAYLALGQYEEAGKLFENYSLELLNQESTLLHPLYGCYLYVTEGEEIARIHFAGVIDTPFPRSWGLLGHELTNGLTKNPAWMAGSFMWERKQLYRQLRLYYRCLGNKEQEALFRQLERRES